MIGRNTISWHEEDSQTPSPYALGALTSMLAALGIVAVAALALFNSITRLQNFSPDSLAYIDVAQNWAAGRGFCHSALISYGQRDWGNQALLPPCTLWAPLYPMGIGVLHWMGLPAWGVALAIPFGALALFLVAIYRLCRHIYNDSAAWLAVMVLSMYGPVYLCARFAWSEMPALACLALAFWFLVSAREKCGRLFISGIFFGLTFAARYVLFPAIGLGVLILMWSSFSTRKDAVQEHGHLARDVNQTRNPTTDKMPLLLCRVGALLLAFSVVAACVLGHNWMSDGTFLGPGRTSSKIGLWTNLQHAAYVLCFGAIPSDWTSVEPVVAHQRLWVCLGVVCLGLAVLDRRFGAIRRIADTPPRLLLPLWGIGYCLMLVVYRTMVEIDPIGPRLLAPGLAFLVPSFVAAAVAWIGPAKWCYRAVLALIIGVALYQEVHVYLANPPMAFASHQLDSPRLRWIAQNTTERDLIVGDSTMDIPVYCGFRHTLCLLPGASDQYLDYAGLCAFLKSHAGDFERAFLVFRAGIPTNSSADEAQWREMFGPFIADLVFKRLGAYPGISIGPDVRRTYVFTVDLARF